MKKALPLFALTLSAIALVACGSSSSSSTTTLKLSADPSGAPKYNPTSLSAKAGKVTIEFSNPSATPQDVAVKDPEGKLYGVSSKGRGRTKKGGKISLNLDLKAGKYIYYSTVPGDEKAGMKGTLTIR